jgi:hypothetical protein
MFRKPQRVQQTIEAQEVKERKTRFQIVKLEERIAPAKGGIPGPPAEHCNRFGCGRG